MFNKDFTVTFHNLNRNYTLPPITANGDEIFFYFISKF